VVVDTVGDDLAVDMPAGEHGGDRSRVTVVEGLHPVEGVDAVPSPRVDGRHGALVARHRVPDSGYDPVSRQQADELIGALEFGGEGHHPDQP